MQHADEVRKMAERQTTLEAALKEKEIATADGAGALKSAQQKHAASLKLLNTKHAATLKAVQVPIHAGIYSLILHIDYWHYSRIHGFEDLIQGCSSIKYCHTVIYSV